MSSTLEKECSHHCGYFSQGQDLIEHELNEHVPCPDCGMGADQDLEVYSLAHRSSCPRLAPSNAQAQPDEVVRELTP